jgi:hypothetical protein
MSATEIEQHGGAPARHIDSHLAAALDALTPVQRAVLVRYAGEEGNTGWLQDLFVGLVHQMVADDEPRAWSVAIASMVEMSLLADLEADHQREVDEIAAGAFGPLPQRTEGIEWWPED